MTRLEAFARFGKKHRIGRCAKCQRLYVWGTPSPRGLGDLCPRPLELTQGECRGVLSRTTWGGRAASAVLLP